MGLHMKSAFGRPLQYVIQVDQNPERSKYHRATNVHLAPCITPLGKYLIMPDKRWMSSAERGKLQGFSVAHQQQFFANAPVSLRNDLFGNAFSTTVSSAAILSLLVAWDRS